MGGRVMRNLAKEIGHFEITLTEAGRRDPLFAGLPSPLQVIQWHGDTFTIPAGGVRLAESSLCANQAFRIRQAVGLQFHLEIDRGKMSDWMDEYADELPGANAPPEELLSLFDEREAGYLDRCRRLIANFLPEGL